MNRYTLTEEIRNEFLPIVESFVDKMDSLTEEEVEGMDNEEFVIDFSDTKLNPYLLMQIMKELGYHEEEFNENGWQWDFSVEFTKDGSFPSTSERLQVLGCGITFELKLSVSEFI